VRGHLKGKGEGSPDRPQGFRGGKRSPQEGEEPLEMKERKFAVGRGSRTTHFKATALYFGRLFSGVAVSKERGGEGKG